MINLLDETIKRIKESKHGIKDIIFIGREKSGHHCTWRRFKVLADLSYDNDYGTQEITPDLIIVFSDGVRMERQEYDGLEWWKIIKPFKQPEKLIPLTSLLAEG